MLFNETSLAGKRILITGGGTGLGKGIALHLAAHGAEVHLWGRRLEVLQAAADEINMQHGGRAQVQAVDIRKFDQVDSAVADGRERFGPLTGVMNNAGGNFTAPTKDLTPRGYEATHSVVMD